MKSTFRNLPFTILATAAVALFSGVSAQATGVDTAIQITSGGASTCMVGACDTASLQTGALNNGANASSVPGTPFSFTYTVPGTTDMYSVTGSYSSSYGTNGSTFVVQATSTFVGNSGNGNSLGDTLTVDFFQDYFDSGPGVFDGVYTESVPVTVGTNTSLSSNLFWNGQAVGVLGPYVGPGSFYGFTSKNLTGLTGNFLAADFQLTFTFAAGATPGTTSSVVDALAPANISKTFGAATIPFNGVTTLTFTLTNPSNAATLTGVGFTDNFPAGLSVAPSAGTVVSPSCGSATFNPTPGSTSVSASGISLAGVSGTPQVHAGAAGMRLRSNAAVAPCTLTVNVTGTSPGTLTNVTGNVTSNVSPAGNTATASLTVLAPVSLSPNPLSSGVVGQPYTAFIVATGGFGGYQFSGSGLPPGLNLSTFGQISGTPTAGGSFSVSVTATDGNTQATAVFPLTIAYAPLQVTSSGVLGGFVPSASISGSLTATGGKAPYTWSASGLPAGFNLNASSGAFSGSAAPGTYSFGIKVADSQTPPATATSNVSFSVLGITTTSLPTASTTSAYSQSVSAVGGTQPYTFTGTGLPPGLSLSTTGQVTGTATQVGSFSATIQVKDSTGLATSSSVSIVVTGPTSLLTVSGGALPSGNVSVAYSTTLQATGGTGPYTWTLTGGTLPTGFTLGTSGLVQGTTKTAGTYTFTAQATDTTTATASGTFTITIAPAGLTFSLGSFPTGIVGTDYPLQILTANGGTPPYTFSIASGSLPPGLTFTTPQFSGTPTTSGTYPFSIAVTDSTNATFTVGGSIVINPAHADLVLSQSSVSFSLTVGSAGLPTPASVPVRSSVVLQLLNYAVSVTPAAPWLDVTGGGTTPGSVSIALDKSALSLGASNLQTTINVTCLTPSPCAGNVQTIAVSLAVSAPAPQLSVNSSLLSFQAATASPGATSQSLGIQNTGGGVLTINSITPADSWLSVSGVPSSVSAGPAVPITVTANSSGLAPNYYTSTLNIASSAGSLSVPVSLLVLNNLSMSLAPAGTQFATPAGSAPGNTNGSFLVLVSGGASASWSASVLPGASWLSVSTPSGTSSASAPGSVSFSISPTISAGLAPQAYYGTIRITSSNVVDSPLDFGIVLNVTQPSAPVHPNPSPAGLVFFTTAGGGAVSPQPIQVFASSTAALPYQASAATTDGANWLGVSPPTGSASSSAPGSSSISVNPTGLAAGVYRGGVSYAFSSAAVSTVNVTLVVSSSGSSETGGFTASVAHATACTPSSTIPTQTGLVSNFQQPVGWPTPLSVTVVNNCGNPVPTGQVVASFSNGDPPLTLMAVNSSSGVYTGTWTPRTVSSQVTITAAVTATGLSSASTQITGEVTANASPVLNANGVLHVFNPHIGGAVAPGTILQIYGSNLSPQAVTSSTVPLTTVLGGTSVLIGGIAAPLYYVSPGQINAQAPFELVSGNQYQVQVSVNGALSTPGTLQIGPVSPGVAALSSGQTIAQHLDGSLVSSTSPAKPGEYVVLYLAGLGATDNPVATGAGSPSSPLAHPLIAPTLTLSGVQAPIAFAGLTPTVVGLYQINFQIPATAANGTYNLVVSQSGVASNSTILQVHN